MPGPANRVLDCAEGYLRLGMLEEALQELSSLKREEQFAAPALQLRVAIFIQGKRWTEALEASEALVIADPETHHGYLHVSYCLHELGRTGEARDRLQKVPEFVRHQPLYCYNLACYEAQLGDHHSAEDWLEVAFSLDHSLIEVARTDTDLAPLGELLEDLLAGFSDGGDAPVEEWDAEEDEDWDDEEEEGGPWDDDDKSVPF
ncbi:MAG: hypothetical protein AAF191_06290 [Verrucomicrobiota bacterium]